MQTAVTNWVWHRHVIRVENHWLTAAMLQQAIKAAGPSTPTVHPRLYGHPDTLGGLMSHNQLTPNPNSRESSYIGWDLHIVLRWSMPQDVVVVLVPQGDPADV